MDSENQKYNDDAIENLKFQGKKWKNEVFKCEACQEVFEYWTVFYIFNNNLYNIETNEFLFALHALRHHWLDRRERGVVEYIPPKIFGIQIELPHSEFLRISFLLRSQQRGMSKLVTYNWIVPLCSIIFPAVLFEILEI